MKKSDVRKLMKISYLLSLLVLTSHLPLKAESIDNSKAFSKSAPADAGIINKERILYWLEKRGELAENATDQQKKLALTHYLAKKSFKPKVMPVALSKKVTAVERFSSREFREKYELK